MKLNLTLQIKAAFLMIVFSMNTIIGFACAVGINMGFNSDHHNEMADNNRAAIKLGAPISAHQKEIAKCPCGENNNQRQSNDKKDNCCNDLVMGFNHLDKYAANSLNISNRIFFISLISTFHTSENLFSTLSTTGIQYFARSYHPPIPDIRIAIQSFQI